MDRTDILADEAFEFTNLEPSHNWKPGRRMTTRKSASHTISGAISMLASACRRDDLDLPDLTRLAELELPTKMLGVAVATLRRKGHSWGEIAGALGVARPTAFQRFASFEIAELEEREA